MPSLQPKQMMPICILKILMDKTDEEHTLTQAEIQEYLKEYMEVERKAVHRNLVNMIYSDFLDIGYTETIKIVKDKSTGEKIETPIYSDFYYKRDFEQSEIKLLIDSVIFSKAIPNNQSRDLIDKLAKLSGPYFNSRNKHVRRAEGATYSGDWFYTIEILDEAIEKNQKVKFHYCEYKTDKISHPKLGKDGKIKEYIVNPYQMAAKDGKYYLICNTEPHSNLSHYRVERISDICILEDKVKPVSSLSDVANVQVDLESYLNERLYMYTGKMKHIKFRITKNLVKDMIDMFGKEIEFSDEDSEGVTVCVRNNEMSMRSFAKQFAPDVIILEPQSLAQEVQQDLENALKLYRGKKES